jgi:hypothetical protein
MLARINTKFPIYGDDMPEREKDYLTLTSASLFARFNMSILYEDLPPAEDGTPIHFLRDVPAALADFEKFLDSIIGHPYQRIVLSLVLAFTLGALQGGYRLLSTDEMDNDPAVQAHLSKKVN